MDDYSHAPAAPLPDGMHPMIAWVMPVYNGERYIEQAIESILLQPCRDCEVWVVDDGSTDATAQIVRSIADERVHYLYQNNAGVSAARNNGIRNSRSKYVAFLDADDVMCKDAYDKEIHRILENGKYDLLSFSYFESGPDLKRGRSHITEPSVIHSDKIRSLGARHFASFLYSRTIFEGDEPVSFPEGIKNAEDDVFQFLVYQKANQLLQIHRFWFLYRKNNTSVTHQLTSHEYLIKEVVPAWRWCKLQRQDKMTHDECDGRVLHVISLYIQSSCLDGVPIEIIQEAIASAPLQETLENYDALWPKSKIIYESFMTDPEAYYKSLWKGRLMMLVRKALFRFPKLKILLTYRDNISSYVYSVESLPISR